MSSVPTEQYRDHRLPLHHGATATTELKLTIHKAIQGMVERGILQVRKRHPALPAIIQFQCHSSVGLVTRASMSLIPYKLAVKQ